MNAGAQLREQEEPFDSAWLMAGLEVYPAGLAVVESGRVLYANRAFGKTNGFGSSSELQGQPLTDLLPKDTRYLDSSETQFSLDSGPVQIEASVYDFQEKQREFQLVCVRAFPQRNSGGVPSRESQKLETIDQSFPGIAHDFGNVLTGILLYSDLLIAGLEEHSRLRRHAEAIRRSGINGVTLVQQLMNPSRKETADLQPLSWNQIISDMESLLIRLAGENISIESKLAESLGLVKMDAGKMQQIILNLVLNARYAMPGGGKITLSTSNRMAHSANSKSKASRAVSWVEVSVTDTGTGMDKKTLAHVFRPFFTTKPRDQGSGLGLTIVRSIVKEGGGEIEIDSELGKGTRVVIRLPRIHGSGRSN